MHLAGYRRDAIDGLTRFTPTAPDLEGFVVYCELSTSSVEQAISTQIDYFKAIARPFEWKVYTFDSPPDLASRLEARGFVPGETEKFMVYDVESLPPAEGEGSVRIERITTDAGIDQIAAVQEEIWGGPHPWLTGSLRTSLDTTAVYCAYVDDLPVGTGWIDFYQDSSFADLHGGAVLPRMRGRGIYSALFRIRILEAKRRGYRFVAVDAAPMSRPILLKKGFRFVCDTIPFRKPA